MMTSAVKFAGRAGRRRRWTTSIAALSLLAALCATGASPAHGSTIVTAWAWGANAYGELGNGTTTNSSVAVSVSGLPNGATKIAAGARHSFAIQPDGSVVAWGRDAAGELGNGGTANSSTPVAVSGLGAGSGVVALAGGAPPISSTSPSGDGHSMALKSDGTVVGWGNNNSGEVGNGTASTTDVLTPVAVVGLGSGSGVTAIAAGGSHSLALKSDGTVLAWGNNNSGQLGDTTLTDHPSPAPVSGLGAGSGVIAIAAGTSFSMALTSNGTVWAWGNNASGQLGDGTAPTDHTAPVQVSGLGAGSNVVQIVAGDAFAVALKSDGTILAWGNNASGELGDGTAPTDHITPVSVSGITGSSGVVAISAGFTHVIARTSAGTYYAWGRNASGQLGDGSTTQHNTPELVSTFPGASLVSAGGSHTLALRAQNINPAVSIGDQTVLEGDSSTRKLTFPVTLSQPSSTQVTVHYAVTDNGSGSGFAQGGSAAGGGIDYKLASGTVTFAVGASGKTGVLKTVSVTVFTDTVVEPDETLQVTLSGPSVGYALGRSVAVGTILNDDAHATPVLGIGSLSSIVEGDFGAGRKLVFPVTLSRPATATVTVQYAIGPLNATYGKSVTVPGADYGGATSGTITFAVSANTGLTPTAKTISVPIWPDLSPEDDEVFVVQLSNVTGLPSSALIQTNAFGVIINDDSTG